MDRTCSNEWSYPWERVDNPWRWIKQAFLAINHEVESLLRPIGLSVQQWRTLGVLYRRPGLTHTDLERILHIEKPSVTSLVNGMVNRGWAERKQNAHDARIKEVYLTPEGQRMHEVSAGVPEKALEVLDGKLTTSDLEMLRILLQKITEAYK